MPITIPDFETLAVDRLHISNQEIQLLGLRRVYRLSPVITPDLGEYPLAAVIVGPMKAPIPYTSAGRFEMKRDFFIDLPVATLPSTTDTGNNGAEALTRALPWFAIVRNYYLNHTNLHTDGTTETAKPALQYLYGDLSFLDNGMTQLGNYVGIRYTLTLTFHSAVHTLA